ncbi:low affinity potassium transporter [Steccherinum ochraceum]|uniref:Potassium transport protein n=1 Tax=Steccherinum ochraceum TaxID=92696 RepID=A0A4R0RSV1_9APHY|nr:low affinity potassium transporter [Steccherinum ochraceum]
MTVQSLLDDVNIWCKRELNFFRIHLLFFVIVPLVSAAIFWGANGRFQIPFVDALFLCYSALTVTGLSTVNLSTCTVFQQAILFFLMCIGNVTVVAWVMVLIRKHYFKSHLEQLKMKELAKRKIGARFLRFTRRRANHDTNGHVPQRAETLAPEAFTEGRGKIFVEEGIGAALVGGGSAGIAMGIGLGALNLEDEKQEGRNGDVRIEVEQPTRRNTEDLPTVLQSPTALVESPPPSEHSHDLERVESNEAKMLDDQQFTSESPKSVARSLPTSPPPLSPHSQATRHTHFADPYMPAGGNMRRRGIPMPKRQLTVYSNTFHTGENPQLGLRAKDQGQGGFPGPIQISQKVAQTFLPRLTRILKERWAAHTKSDKAKFGRLSERFSNLIIGRNSDFNTEELTDEELEELGGLEYRALNLLSYLVAFYFVGTQLIALTLIAPWLSTAHQYDEVFTSQPRLVNKTWFTAFQVVGSYTGGGMSLVDQGMVPFQRAYLMIFAMMFTIIAGNQGLPIFLRLTIWIMTKFVSDNSPMDQTLHFLLDHPRRCFLYLFPSHVTWFLLATFTTFTTIEWVSFIVLDIGLDVIESLPPGIRALTGIFQSCAVRASGFPIVSLSSLAPSFQFLCIVMMYIAVYPVALSIRSTNVYEEQSLGVFEAEPEDQDEEPAIKETQGSRAERIGRYFGWHLRRQVTYDIWWLVWGIFLICIIERTKIMDDDNAPWFNLFRIIFELVSAFGGIGLTLGIPTENYSFAGAFGPLSKLVVIIIMLRGRHRGLPVAIDRAILLPADMVPASNPEPRSPTSNLTSFEKARSFTTAPQMERRVYSSEGPQPNMMDLVDIPRLPPKVTVDTSNLDSKGQRKQSPMSV